jgi:hypothetical protein
MLSIFDLIGIIGLNKSQIADYVKNRKAIEFDMKIARIEIKDLENKRTGFLFSFLLSTLLLRDILPFIV